MLDKIKFNGKEYNVCDKNKTSLYNNIINNKKINGSDYPNLEKKLENKIKNKIEDIYINDEIFNIENDIFSYQIFTDYYIYNEYIKSINLDKSIGFNSNIHYIKFIQSLPWTYELDKTLDKYINCEDLMENHFRKKPDRPNITFCNIPIKYNKLYYRYVLYINKQCINCQENEEEGCNVYNKLINFLNKKFSNKKYSKNNIININKKHFIINIKINV